MKRRHTAKASNILPSRIGFVSRNQKPLSVLMLAVVAVAGITFIASSRAATPYAVVETEQGTIASPASIVSDASASGGQAVVFASTPTTPTPPPTGTMPSMQWIIDNAGPTNAGILQSSGTITVTEDNAVVENVDVSGIISVKANNVTIRNCKVSGYSSVNVIRLNSGFTNLTVEHCRVEALVSADGNGPNGAIGGNGGSHMTVRHSEILGFADGIKAESDSLYEYNYIHMSKPSGSAKHLDGMQGSGDSRWTARFNYVDMRHEQGGNFPLFAQAWNGANCIHITDVEFSHNYIYGGNYGFSFAGGKDGRCTDPADPSAYITNVRAINNVFLPDADGIWGSSSTAGYRYGYWSINRVQSSELTISGNKLPDGTAITSGTQR